MVGKHAEDPPWDVGELVQALRTARSSQEAWRMDEAEQRQRPSRDAIVRVVADLRAVLFPSHFGISEFSEESIDFFVGNTLDRTLRQLEEQVRRALRYVPPQAISAPGDPRALVGLFAQRLPAIRMALEHDIRAAYEGDPAAQSRSEVIFCYPGITAIIHHRIAHELYRLGVPLVPRVISEIAHGATGIDIHPGAQIGERFFIDHGTGVVIGETSVIGNRVRVYQGVTLGARNFPRDGEGVLVKGAPRHPVIEDDVVIYAGATILGRITIGRGSTIGGNVWLTRSLPPDSHIAQAQLRGDPEP
ncbi:MAG TPA: serine O-acetyltransferase EpsC [Polyangiales bacterium]|nr:serine O-acetyltransferase EpsC [Polyangiales bacterium]